MDSFQPHDFILVEMEDNVSTIKRLDVSRYSPVAGRPYHLGVVGKESPSRT